MKNGILTLATMVAGLFALSSYGQPQITDVKAEPMSPWGKVAISYTLSEDAVDGIILSVTASNRATKVVYEAQSLAGDLSYKKGTHRIWWDMAKDKISLKQASVDFRITIIEGVQLWEDGPYWATKNIGATKPEEAGYYFWWGDTVGYKRVGDSWDAVDGSKTGFSFDNEKCPTHRVNYSTLKAAGYITSAGVLADKYDAAKKHWGGNWRMPTADEFQGIVDNCTTIWTTQNGVNGRLVTGKGTYASKSIFLPAAGNGRGSLLDYSGSYGNYLSSTPNSTPYSSVSSSTAYILSFYFGNLTLTGAYDRYLGYPVRPVLGFTK